ncbi:hypothetical protein A2V49_00120 [candidate division WWE3 bacterium RBG_19FT_COMBO_34_6]|uniref:Glycosyltransferase 2-like domain-containing protein n=1 Tax=candidate division WWE3 bacterium RBG_19FT_COMBO_34_6 TaxID=1802612 RepID=A0A1F4UK44_UNCKA|nr:MAG: hypothetical protein A2V49_00120 [candidate division WWE3 bacterium RBG_19FT_COMBO_34_6]
MNIVIVIPTYNEAENIKKLIPLLTQQILKFSHHKFDILVVDGNSPDGTGRVVNDFADKYSNIHLLLEQKKSGIGAAYFYGFKYAMQKLSADALIEMDADLQHKPEDLYKLVEEFDKGYDYVLGSRYVKGGGIPKEWSLYRKFLSYVGGSLFCKFVLGIFNINDFTTGFKISRVKGFVDQIKFNEIDSKSFGYKVELLYRMYKLGAKIKEVPIIFGLRDRGNSKIEKDTALEILKIVLSIRYSENRNFFKFLIVGFTGLFVDSSIFSIIRLTSIGSSTASFLSGFIAMITTFSLNNFWSFKERKFESSQKAIINFIIYFISSYIPIIFRSFLIKFSVTNF